MRLGILVEEQREWMEFLPGFGVQLSHGRKSSLRRARRWIFGGVRLGSRPSICSEA